MRNFIKKTLEIIKIYLVGIAVIFIAPIVVPVFMLFGGLFTRIFLKKDLSEMLDL